MDGNIVGERERTRPVESGPELEMLAQMLDFLRGTVVLKAAGLTTGQSVSHPIPSTELSVASLVKHLTGIERFWFSIDFAGSGVLYPWLDDDPHGAFPLTPDDTIGELIAAYEDECARSRCAVADASPDEVAHGDGMHFTLRYCYLHMIEETARHCGHIDLIREAIDGARGE